MARVGGISQFYLPLTRSSTNAMNHPANSPGNVVIRGCFLQIAQLARKIYEHPQVVFDTWYV